VGPRVGLEVLGMGNKTFATVRMRTALFLTVPGNSVITVPPELAISAPEYKEILFTDVVQFAQCCTHVILCTTALQQAVKLNT